VSSGNSGSSHSHDAHHHDHGHSHSHSHDHDHSPAAGHGHAHSLKDLSIGLAVLGKFCFESEFVVNLSSDIVLIFL
jgi:hypothetical protein